MANTVTPNFTTTIGTVGSATITVSGTVAATQSGSWTIQPLTNASIVKAQLQDNAGAAVILGQTLMATSVPVTLASNQTALPVSQSGNFTIQPLTNSSIVKAQLQDNAGTAIVLGQTTMAASVPVTLASNQSALSVAQSGNFRVGGYTVANSTAHTVTSSQAYTTGQCLGGLLTISGALRADIGTGLIQQVVVSMTSSQTVALDLLIFNANPTGSTTTDTNAFVIATADIAAWVGTIHLTDVTAGGASAVRTQWQALSSSMPIAAASGTTFYALLVARGSLTTGTSELCQVVLKVLQD